jgi:hypothetical protein
MKAKGTAILKLSAGFLMAAGVFLGAPGLSGLSWPPGVSVVTDFADGESALQPEEPTPFLALGQAEGRYEFSDSGTVIFQGTLANGLGSVALTAQENDLRILYGNLDGSSRPAAADGSVLLQTEALNGFSDVRKPLLMMVFDQKLHQIVNPELILDNPPGNQTPTLRRMRFSAIAADGSLSAPIDIWSWYRRSSVRAGEYLVDVDWADGRFSWNDIRDIHSLRMYVNGQLKFRQGLEYMAEDENRLVLLPGRSVDSRRVPISIRPGTNIIEVYVEDPKGLSQSYEFTIDGGLPQP